MKEASARIKINRLLEAAGWRFFADEAGLATIRLESKVTLNAADLDALGENFEKSARGFVDFLLLNDKGIPVIVLEAKAESKDPLVGKEQARKYAKSQNCRFVILSNGNLHYFWDLEHGNPHTITTFPTPASVQGIQKAPPDPLKLAGESVQRDYIALSQRPGYASEAGWKNESERPDFIAKNGLRFLREYQLKPIRRIQQQVAEGHDRFLLEMATGTGKTLTAAAIIKLFLRSGNAQRVLFLVDRLELEDQAAKAFRKVLSNDYKCLIYKENRDEWRRAEIVVTTIQSLLFNNKYLGHFSPTDFDLLFSDEAHRSIGGNARAVFNYFLGYKVGLTATPRDYLKNFKPDHQTSNDPREFERRLLLDTYRAFGCDDGEPTFRYSLIDGVKDDFLVSPTVVDVRTDVTTQLLADQGFVVQIQDDAGQTKEEAFKLRQFEKRFFSLATNQLLCKTFLEKALRDPISGEIGKSIVFAVSQLHASKLTQILNDMADKMYPGKYNSDFAVQVTSDVSDAQQFTINFANNNLLGSGNFIPAYKTSKARVCVTVGMMTTGYDCQDILNLALMRPVFSPTDFIQMKGRGTRKHDFREQLFDESIKEGVTNPLKTTFKLFDFFANCEYFEDTFDYDEVVPLPRIPNSSGAGGGGGGPVGPGLSGYEHLGTDLIATIEEEKIGVEGMKIDRMFFQSFEDRIKGDAVVAASVDAGHWDKVIEYVTTNVLNNPTEPFTLDKLRRAASVDRRLTLREILEKIFGLIPRFKSKDELLEEEFAKFLAEYRPEKVEAIPALKTFFKAYATNDLVRHIIESGQLTDLNTNPVFTIKDYKAVPDRFRTLIPEYIKDYVPLNQFVA
jgi:type I restriction enzyme R subunit